MNMRYFFMIIGLVLFMSACQSTDSNQSDASKIVVTEVLQTSNYTYVKGDVAGSEQWFAISKAEIEVGKSYYFAEGMLMENFESKELKRTFEKITFLEGISTEPITAQTQKEETVHNEAGTQQNEASHQSMKPKTEQKEIAIEPAKGAITIAELFSNKKDYDGKVVKIKAEVVKYSPAIMNKNWIHLQDGTKHSDKFDLTITSDAEFKVGDIVTIEGKVALDKDFGYGYCYEGLLEEAKVVE